MLFAVAAVSDFAGKLSALFIVLAATADKVKKLLYFKAIEIYAA